MIADEEPILLIKRTFKASAEDVFDAWLTLERWQAWIGLQGDIARAAWRRAVSH